MKKHIIIFLFVTVNLGLRAQFTVMDTSVTHTDAALFGAFFTNDSTGYAVGGWPGIAGVILKTTDAGASWSVKVVNYYLTSVTFTSRDTGYAVGSNTTVMKTIDAGVTWTYLNTSIVPSSYLANSVCFINNDSGFVGLVNGPGYAFLKTYNGGTTWINDVSDTINVQSMFLVKPRTIFTIGDKLSKTTNMGASWTMHPLLPISTGNTMYFFNDSVGFATLNRSGGDPCFEYTTVVKTIDGGETWSGTDYNCGGWFGTILFASNNVGYMLGAVRRLLKTSDGGVTWNHTSTWTLDSWHTSNSPQYLLCTDTNTCYIFTNDGVIIKTTNGGGPTDVGINESNIQNASLNIYPNPTTDQITIEFDATETKSILEIKNVLGQTVYSEMLIDVSGKKSKSIDVSNFSNGIYFLSIKNEKGMMSKKFIKE